MRAFCVVIDSPVFDDFTRLADAGEPVLVQTFIPEAPIDGEDGPAPEKGLYAGPTLQKELSHDPSRYWP